MHTGRQADKDWRGFGQTEQKQAKLVKDNPGTKKTHEGRASIMGVTRHRWRSSTINDR